MVDCELLRADSRFDVDISGEGWADWVDIGLWLLVRFLGRKLLRGIVNNRNKHSNRGEVGIAMLEGCLWILRIMKL